ncbi:DUF1223 domain-containing protein [Croceitalea rosinachiae]|uniref:DUF1223 domain-containing protein n=1 Tax=Croceitalea rosinachiae TaxID=3075596 RepID=A0ABU3AE46_9FLAO|nr:DUF1223 domain-containing protein [Croceitalea sp. F388]MDT0608451.1 DUF1223 domain-containing protein [Croceitalea sp. F388]
MYKKIIIPVVIVIALSSMAFYQSKVEDEAIDIPTPIELEGYEPIVVLELFTSQGCSSCPPADILLDKAKSNYPENVFALSYHVDYWNYIGWEDPFSKSAFSVKQRAYNQKFRSRSNYTPQMVVNGLEHFVGSNQSKLTSKIRAYSEKDSENKVLISNIKKTGASISFDYALQGELKGKNLRTVVVLDSRTTSVKRGENRNRTLKNSNIVVSENYLRLTTETGSGNISIPSFVKDNESITLILIVEKDDLAITGAAKHSA